MLHMKYVLNVVIFEPITKGTGRGWVAKSAFRTVSILIEKRTREQRNKIDLIPVKCVCVCVWT